MKKAVKTSVFIGIVVVLYWVIYPMWLWCRAPFPDSREVEVLNDLKGLRLAMMMYADDNHQKCPTSVADLKAYHYTPKTHVEICPVKEWPADYSRVVLVGYSANPLPSVYPPPFLPSWFSVRGWPTNAIGERRVVIYNDGSVKVVLESQFTRIAGVRGGAAGTGP